MNCCTGPIRTTARIGSEGLIRALLARGAIGLVTTHDLSLSRVADELAPAAANVHFEDRLEDGRLVFDYRMRPGVVERSNALDLMRAVGWTYKQVYSGGCMSSFPATLATRIAPGKLRQMEAAIELSIRGKAEAVRMALVCLLARGHLLIEDVPGVGKTTLAQSLARAVDGAFHRLQFTSDMLPSDVLGVTVYNAHTEEFEFKPGPVFTNFLLADEINRTTPKTQSALLEAMNEQQVSVEGRTLPLPEPFMVIATQNPADHHGTYPLPESQLDRFLMRLRIGYPDCRERARNHPAAGSASRRDHSAACSAARNCANCSAR